MARKKTTKELPLSEETTTTPPSDVQVRLTGEAAKNLLRSPGGNGSSDEERAAVSSRRDGKAKPQDSKRARIAEALRDPRNRVAVRRLFPRTAIDPASGQTINAAFEVFASQCPLELLDIEEEVFGKHGGYKYQLRILNEDNDLVEGDVIENPSTREPIMQPIEEENLSPLEIPLEEAGEDTLDKAKKSIERQLELGTKRRELQTLREMLEDDTRKTPVPPPGRDGIEAPAPRVAALEQQNKLLAEQIREMRVSMERQREEDKFSAVLRDIKEQHSREIADLKEQMRGQQQQGSPTQELILKLIDKGEARVATLMDSMKESMSHALSGIKEAVGRRSGAAGSVGEVLEVYRAINAIVKNQPIDDGEPRPWYEVLVDKAPAILDKFSETLQKTRGMDKGEADKIAQQQIDIAINELIKEGKLVPAAPAPASLPASPAPGALPPAGGSPKPSPQTEAAAAPLASEPQKTEADVRREAVAEVVKVIALEAGYRPAECQWIDAALRLFPGDLNDALVAAKTPIEVYGVLQKELGAAHPELLKLQNIAMSNQKAQEWLTRTFNEYREELSGDGEEEGKGE